jgi:hypothetical protein
MITQRPNAGGLVGGTLLIGLGIIFLLGQFVGFRGFELIWPLLVVGLGVAFFVGMLAGGKSLAGLAVPGSVLTAIGLVLLFQSVFGHWEAWAYGWTIIFFAVGVGIFIMGAWAGNPVQRQSGLRVAGIGLVLFVFFGAFFELMIFGGQGEPWRRAVAPILLILAGVILLVRRGFLPGGFGSLPPQAPPDAPPDGRPTPPAQSE